MKTDQDLRISESIGLFFTLTDICVLVKMSDETYRIYRSGVEIAVFQERDEAEDAMWDYRELLEKEAVEAGAFVRRKWSQEVSA